MKTNRYLLFFILSVLSFSSCSRKDEVQSEYEKMGLKNNISSINDKERYALKIYSNLETAFENYVTRSKEKYLYPDYYGGAFVDDKGDLVILVTDTSHQIKHNLMTYAKSPDISFEKCIYSFNELNELNKELSSYFSDQQLCEELTWEGSGIDVRKNCIIISLKDCSNFSIHRFKQRVMDSPMLKFEQIGEIQWDSECIPIDSVQLDTRSSFMYNLHLGSAYHLTGKTESGEEAIFRGSVGFRAMRMNGLQLEHGFVTAAHCLPKIGMKIKYGRDGDLYLGVVRDVKLNTTSDVAFVAVDYTTYYPTNCAWVTKTPIADSYLKYNSLVGYHIVTEGQKSAMPVLSIIALLNQQVRIKQWTAAGNVNFIAKNMVVATFTGGKTQEGDSGAIVYTESGSRIVGVHSGQYNSNQYISSANLATQELLLRDGWYK